MAQIKLPQSTVFTLSYTIKAAGVPPNIADLHHKLSQSFMPNIVDSFSNTCAVYRLRPIFLKLHIGKKNRKEKSLLENDKGNIIWEEH